MKMHRSIPSKTGTAAVPDSVHDVLRSAGKPLGTAVRAQMESRFGRDFSQVRVHTDEAAAEASRDVAARAFTTGRNIVFGAAQYRPETGPGQALIAHELTHVVQQGAGTEPPTRVGKASDPAEREASGAAQAIALGGNVSVKPSSAPASVQCEDKKKIDLFPKDVLRELVKPPLLKAADRKVETERAFGSGADTTAVVEEEAKQRAKAEEAKLKTLSGLVPGGSAPPGSTADKTFKGIGQTLLNDVILKKILLPFFNLKADFGGGGSFNVQGRL